MHAQLWLSQHMPSVLDTVPDRVTSCSRFSNNNWWKMIIITLPVNYQQSLLHQWTRVQGHPGHKTPSTELTTQMQRSPWVNTLISTELTTPVQYSLGVRVKEQTFQIVSKMIVNTSKHYKLSNKHVTEVSTDVWNCLIELEWLEDIVCLSRTHSSEEVSDQIKTVQNQSKNKENWEETYLVDRRY